MAQGKKSADEAVKAEAQGKASGKYKVTVTGTIEKNGNPDPNPLGDYKAQLRPTQ
jgi:hypothetical protein